MGGLYPRRRRERFPRRFAIPIRALLECGERCHHVLHTALNQPMNQPPVSDRDCRRVVAAVYRRHPFRLI